MEKIETEKVWSKFDSQNFSVQTRTGLMLPGKKDDKNVQQKLLSVTKSLRSETLLRREMENHCKKLQNEKLVSHNLNYI